MEHLTKESLDTLLEHHQASPKGAAKGLSLMMLVKEVTSRQVDPVCVVKSGVQHDLAITWPQYCQLRREGMLGKLLLHRWIWRRGVHCALAGRG